MYLRKLRDERVMRVMRGKKQLDCRKKKKEECLSPKLLFFQRDFPQGVARIGKKDLHFNRLDWDIYDRTKWHDSNLGIT